MNVEALWEVRVRTERPLVTFLEGRPIGSQTIEAQNFSARREFETGSWLGAPHQGHGFGTEQRAAVLELGFRGLGAHAAVSGSIVDGLASSLPLFGAVTRSS